MHIGLTYDVQTDPRDERQAEWDPPRVLDALCQALQTLGHDVVRLGDASRLLVSPNCLKAVDLVFNIAEGARGRCREAWAPNLLELAGVPCVGSDALALCLGLDKLASKRLARAEGLRTPAWLAVSDAAQIPERIPPAFPVIVKPRYEGSGIGIDEGAVVHDRQALQRRAAAMLERWRQPMLIEEFIPDGELTVCLIGNSPPTAYPAVQRAIDPRTRLSCHVARACLPSPDGDRQAAQGDWITPLELTEPLEREAQRIALVMFETLGCADMARVDVRVDAQGRAWFLEINPLPSLDPEGSFGLLAESAGLSYPRMIGRILDAACQRLGLVGTPVKS
ncbi:MAG: D-alanine--D-alanine ligase [Candidatus Omnitrophica bacterium]|nr:D-alanine--D-alanine ligase [Candidatus Omnitrophota bacterium]